MPAARDYVCTGCHFEFEKFQDTFEESPECPACSGPSEWVPSFYYSRPRAASGFTPVVVHRAADGSLRYPGSADAPVPSGFTRVELTTLPEVRKFEQEVNHRENAILEKDAYNRRVTMDQEIISNREALRDGVRVRDRENPDRIKVMRLDEFTAKGREFHDHMAREADARRARNHSKARKEAGFRVEAFSDNSSNREAYRDAANRFGLFGGGRK